MAKSLTLKNLPEALHERLAAAAKRHRRSLNNEAILCLEAGLRAAPPKVHHPAQNSNSARQNPHREPANSTRVLPANASVIPRVRGTGPSQAARRANPPPAHTPAHSQFS
jgi:plasmid stability protein